MSLMSEAPFRPFPFLERSIETRQDAAGVLYMRSTIPVGPQAPHIPYLFSEAARSHPDRVWLAQRKGQQREWQKLSYGQAKPLVDSVSQSLLNLGKPGAGIVMLSDNSLEHAVLQLAAMQARMPFGAITPAYSLLAKDFTKLRDMVGLIEPAVVFVQNGIQFQRALSALELDESVTVVCVDDMAPGMRMVSWGDWISTPSTQAVEASTQLIARDTVAKYLFSSGSTGTPKAIIMTQRMLIGSVAAHGKTASRNFVEPPVNITWMPWSHVAGGNSVFHNTIAAAGTLYLDGGKPIPGAFEETLHNLREVSPTQFGSVPAGYTMLVEALEADDSLAANFFRDLRTMSFSGARMPEFVHDRMQKLAVAHTGFKIPIVSGWGLTETSAAGTYVHWYAEKVGIIGLPQPGVELKLLPIGENRYEARMRGEVVTTGYLRNPEQTAAAFDEEGFFKTGDALQFVDPEVPAEGLAFAGRVAEEFKLQTGTFVRVGRLRVDALESAGGLLADAVVTGADEAYVGLLAWLNLDRCRALLASPAASATDLLRNETVREALRNAFDAHNVKHPASSMRIKRVMLLEEPPSLSAGEITDKGYVNQRAVLARRAHLVAQLYTTPAAPEVIEIN